MFDVCWRRGFRLLDTDPDRDSCTEFVATLGMCSIKLYDCEALSYGKQFENNNLNIYGWVNV